MAAINTAISKSGHASFQKVDAVPKADAAQENILYLVMNTTTKHYDIYAKIKGSSDSYTMELLDDTTVDLSGKVDKVAGKGLSTNDYTTAEKTKLAGIAEGANKYVHPSYTAKTSGQMCIRDRSLFDDLHFDESQEWVQLPNLFGSPAIPKEAADTITQALDKMVKEGEIGPKNKWQALEYWAADYLAGK